MGHSHMARRSNMGTPGIALWLCHTSAHEFWTFIIDL